MESKRPVDSSEEVNFISLKSVVSMLIAGAALGAACWLPLLNDSQTMDAFMLFFNIIFLIFALYSATMVIKDYITSPAPATMITMILSSLLCFLPGIGFWYMMIWSANASLFMTMPMFFNIIICIIFLVPFFYIPSQIFFDRRLFQRLSAAPGQPATGQSAFTGQQVATESGVLKSLGEHSFRERLPDFFRLLSKRFIINRWNYDNGAFTVYLYVNAMNIHYTARMRGEPRAWISMDGTGRISLIMNPVEAGRLAGKKIKLTEEMIREALEIFRLSLEAYLGGDPDRALELLTGGKKPASMLMSWSLNGIIVKATFLLVIAFYAGFYFAQKHFPFSDKKPVTRKAALDFIRSTARPDGSMGYEKAHKDCATPIWMTTMSVYFLSELGELDLIDRNRAADYIAAYKPEPDTRGGTCDTKKVSEMDNFPLLSFRIETLDRLNALDRIDRQKLADKIARTQRADGLFEPPSRNINVYKYTHEAITTLDRLGALDKIDFNAAWAALLRARREQPRFLEFYLFDISEQLKIRDPDVRAWVLERYVHRVKSLLKQEPPLDNYGENTLYQASLVLTRYNKLDMVDHRRLKALQKPYAFYDLQTVDDFFTGLLGYSTIENHIRAHPPAFRLRAPDISLIAYIVGMAVLLFAFARDENARINRRIR